MVRITARPDNVIPLGRVGENEAAEIAFPVLGEWQAEYGSGAVHLLAQRKGDALPYPVRCEVENGSALWRVTDADTAHPGYGKAELRYIVGSTVVKSQIYATYTAAALGEGGELPAAYADWVSEVLRARDTVVQHGENLMQLEVTAENAEGAQPSVEKEVDAQSGRITLRFRIPKGSEDAVRFRAEQILSAQEQATVRGNIGAEAQCFSAESGSSFSMHGADTAVPIRDVVLYGESTLSATPSPTKPTDITHFSGSCYFYSTTEDDEFDIGEYSFSGKGLPVGTYIPARISASPLHAAGVYYNARKRRYYIGDTYEPRVWADGAWHSRTVQRIGKYCITGEEDWQRSEPTKYPHLFTIAYDGVSTVSKNSADILCTHFPSSTGKTSNGAHIPANQLGFEICKTDCSDVSAFKSYFAAQYAAGHPVTVYFVLAEPIVTLGEAEAPITSASAELSAYMMSDIEEEDEDIDYPAGCVAARVPLDLKSYIDYRIADLNEAILSLSEYF